MSYESTENLTINANSGNSAINLLYSTISMKNKTCFLGNVTSLQFLDYVTNLNNYYYLPYSDSNRLLIVFGQIKDQNAETVNTFGASFSTIPYVFAQHFTSNGPAVPARITDVTTTTFTCDPQYGNNNKGPYMFFAIGLSS
jgi:hypothetical protein